MTSLTHALIAAAIGSFIVPRQPDRARAQLVLGSGCAVLPDLDLLAPYFGGARDFHRGVTHSLSVAAVVGLTCACYALLKTGRGTRLWLLGCYAALATASHALADMTTTYRVGIALLSPFSEARYQVSWQPIDSLSDEALFISLPMAIVSLAVLKVRRIPLFTLQPAPPLHIVLADADADERHR